MPKNKRDPDELDELDEQEKDIEGQESAPVKAGETEEQALDAEPWIDGPVNVEDAPTAFIQSQWASEDNFPLSDDTVSDNIVVGKDPDSVMNEIKQHTLDIEVLEDFDERQNMATNAVSLEEDLEQNTHQSPKLSGGDVDAAWAYTDQSGEESVGASVPTPDQDLVDEIGEALGISYDDDEELDTAEKLGERDLNRWELDPASAQDMETADLVYREGGLQGLIDEVEDMDLEPYEAELENLLDDEDRDELGDELRDAEIDPLDLDDEDYEDFEDEDLDLLDDEIDDEDLL